MRDQKRVGGWLRVSDAMEWHRSDPRMPHGLGLARSRGVSDSAAALAVAPADSL
jgi:hypothetical protein